MTVSSSCSHTGRSAKSCSTSTAPAASRTSNEPSPPTRHWRSRSVNWVSKRNIGSSAWSVNARPARRGPDPDALGSRLVAEQSRAVIARRARAQAHGKRGHEDEAADNCHEAMLLPNLRARRSLLICRESSVRLRRACARLETCCIPPRAGVNEGSPVCHARQSSLYHVSIHDGLRWSIDTRASEANDEDDDVELE